MSSAYEHSFGVEVELQPLNANHGNTSSVELDGNYDDGTTNCPQPVLVLVLGAGSDVQALCDQLTQLELSFTLLSNMRQDDKKAEHVSGYQFIGVHLTPNASEKYAEELYFHVRFAENTTPAGWRQKIPSLLYSYGLGYEGFNTMYYSAPYQGQYKQHYINPGYIYTSRVGAEIVHSVLLRNAVFKNRSYEIKKYFVPHTPEKKRLEHWEKLYTLCPLEGVRDYYGEQIAFVYAWNNVWLTLGLFPLVLISVGSVVYGACTLPDKSVLLGIKSSGFFHWFSHVNTNNFCYFYGFFMLIWVAVFQHHWTKISSLLSLEWGTSNFNVEEEPIFKTAKSKSSKISKLFIPFPNMVIEMFGFIATCILTLIIFFATEVIRTEGYKANPLKLNEHLLEFIMTVICSLFYSVFNLIMFTFIIPPLVHFITKLEKHKFMTFYDNSIIFKYGGYYIISSYLYLLYLCFFRSSHQLVTILAVFGIDSDYFVTCKYGMCSVTICQELLVQVIILRSVTFVSFGIHQLKALVKKLVCGGRETAEDQDLDYILANYTLFPVPSDCLLPLMIERVVMYGYITLFSFHMPMLSLIGWIIEFIVTKIEVHTLLISQRPLPRRCQNLGQWEGVIHLLNVLSVITTTVSIGISLASQGYSADDPHGITLTILPVFIVVQCLIRELNRSSGDYVQSHKHSEYKALQAMKKGGRRASMVHVSTEL